ncbi:MAG: hypothetical protein NZ608_06940 [candidate division WOR-3 bacterium]|nr:hypothetical protein [candidate division WOR-3 bacterium]
MIYYNIKRGVKCLYCGNPVYTGTKFCSRKCFDEYRKQKSPKSCHLTLIVDGKQIVISPIQNKIAMLIASGLSVEEVSKITKTSQKYVEELLSGEGNPPHFPKLVQYYVNKFWGDDLITQLRQDFLKKYREAMERKTKKDPMEWLKLAFEILGMKQIEHKDEYSKEDLENILRKSYL